jgi:predicted ATPase
LESLPDVAAVGITDYFSVDGYRKVVEFKKAGRLPDISLILPNVELRLDNLLYRTKDETEPPRRLNLHVIFSDEISPNEIEEHFLRELPFNYIGKPQATNEEWKASRPQIEQLGKRIREQQPTFKGTDFEVGCTVVTVDVNDVKRALEGKPSIFKHKYIVVLAEEHLSFMSWEGQDHQVRKVLVSGADAIFSGSPDTREWALGRKDLNVEEFVREFETLKPCIHGCDAHQIDKIGRPDLQRFCWIKADPTFEGLRQILFEPGERVYIGERPPSLKHEFQVIDSITVTGAPDWFAFAPIPISADLAAIIGGRGAGKSALAEILAFAGGSDVFRKPAKENKDTFLYKASLRSPRNMFPVTRAELTLRWRAGDPDTTKIGDDLQTSISKEKVKYLPQKFVEQLCAPENTEQIEREIEKVIFQRIRKTDRLGASDFSELRILTTKSIAVKKDDLRRQIEALNRSIYEGFQKAAQKDPKRSQLAKKESELAELTKQAPTLPEENKADLVQLDSLDQAKSVIEAEIVTLNGTLSTIEELKALFSTFENQVRDFNSRVADLLGAVGLSEKVESLTIKMPPRATVDELLESRRATIDERIERLTAGDNNETIDKITESISRLKEKLNLSVARRQEYDKFQNDKKALAENTASLAKEIREIEHILEPHLATQRTLRIEKYLDFFDILAEERGALERLYEPLREALSTGGDTDKRLTFVAKILFDAANHAEKAMGLLDSRKRKNPYHSQEELENAIKKTMTKIENFGYERARTRDAVVEFRNSFLTDTDGNKIEFKDQLRDKRTEEDFNNWFYDVSNFSVSYSIKFDDKELQLLSPGQKGIVLLLVYLEVEQQDNRPLIIDQPEDNLDSLSVYASLIDYFRKRKKKRQIIIITHNPNLVLNTDAEQILIAHFDGAGNPRIEYRSGALEDVVSAGGQPSIREEICSVLEGGEEAFMRREKKYSLGAP